MIRDIVFWVGKQLIMGALRSQWRTDYYGFGGGAWTGRQA